MLPMEMARPAIEVQRERAERLLNGVRAAVLLSLALTALLYGPHIPVSVQRANWAVLIPTLAWSLAQFWLDERRHLREQPLPSWVAMVNPLVDITAVTAILAGYSFAEPGALALAVIMVGATDASIVVFDRSPIPPFLTLIALLVVAWMRRPSGESDRRQ